MYNALEIFNLAFFASFLDGMKSVQPSKVLFGGFETLLQLMETYRTLALYIGAILFVVGIFLLLFPAAKRFLGDWF